MRWRIMLELAGPDGTPQRHEVGSGERISSESMQNRGELVSFTTLGCSSSTTSLTHHTSFGTALTLLGARGIPERGPSPHGFACPRELQERLPQRKEVQDEWA
jgi:hypothetical protein